MPVDIAGDVALRAWEAGGPVAVALITLSIVAVVWAVRRELKAPSEADSPVIDALSKLTDAVNAMNLERARHEERTDAKLGEHERRLNAIDRRLEK